MGVASPAEPAPIVTLTDANEQAAREAILRPLMRFNANAAGRAEDWRRLAVLLSDPGTNEVIGGLWGETMYDQLHIDLLFIPEPFRRTGLGRLVMAEAEAEAIRRRCRGSWVDTFSFQARGFYEKLGFTLMGVIDDHPIGHQRFFLKKRFA